MQYPVVAGKIKGSPSCLEINSETFQGESGTLYSCSNIMKKDEVNLSL